MLTEARLIRNLKRKRRGGGGIHQYGRSGTNGKNIYFSVLSRLCQDQRLSVRHLFSPTMADVCIVVYICSVFIQRLRGHLLCMWPPIMNCSPANAGGLTAPRQLDGGTPLERNSQDSEGKSPERRDREACSTLRVQISKGVERGNGKK